MASDSISAAISPSSTSTRIEPRLKNSSAREQKSEGDAGTALKDVHHAASRSADMTSFGEYTRPPSPPIGRFSPDVKGPGSDISGSLSGLYNRFLASVAGSKESDITNHVQPTDRIVKIAEKTTSQPSSGRVSRMQSPKILAVDPVTPFDAPLKVTPRSTAPPKISTPLPGVKPSTFGSLPATFLSPALTEVNIHATNSGRSHSRMGSAQESDDLPPPDQVALNQDREQALQKVLSRNEPVTQFDKETRQLRSPVSSMLTKAENRPAASHARELSESSDRGRKLPSRLLTSINNSEGRIERVPVTVGLSSPIDHQSSVNPIQLLDSRHRTIENARQKPHVAQLPDAQFVSPTLQDDFEPKLLPRISHSRLPGFAASRASSTDSSRTPATAALTRTNSSRGADGQADTRQISSLQVRSKPKNHLLNKDFWMKDENARYCFRCGEPFTTFRRKHHCRTCGQIFDSKCTGLVSGSLFGLPGSIRVCRPCESIVTSHEDDSSDYSDADTTMDGVRPQTPDIQSAARYDEDNVSVISQSIGQVAQTPVMNFPLRRTTDYGSRASAIFAFDVAEPTLYRPSSSRSLRTNHLSGHGHKRHASRHQYARAHRAYHTDRAPFQKQNQEDSKGKPVSAFHRDSVIDPELAQYLSDDASSEDEPGLQHSISAEKLPRTSPDNERMTIGGFISAMRKGRPRVADRSIAALLNLNRDGDDAASVVSSRANDGPRLPRKRNLSVASSVHSRPTPRVTRDKVHITLPDEVERVPPSPVRPLSRGRRLMRSASMHGIAAPAVELNRASLQHVHRMLSQLLKDAGIAKIQSWQSALVPILLKATDEVNPDVQDGDDMDIRRYVKLKKIPGGRPGDTSYTSGLIFSKNMALKSMPRTILNPRLLIITFPLEYTRQEQHFMSLDPVLRQESEYLENIIGRIAASKPDLLLSQQNVSGKAIEILQRHKIAVIYHIKPTILEAVSRCTSTPINHSMDRLALPYEQLGTCESFEIKTYVSDGQRKSYVFFSGCPPELGCTITLRGATREVLHKIKKLTEFMIYVVYNLKLETCLMRDEWALISCDEAGVNGRSLVSADVTADDASEQSMELKIPVKQMTDVTTQNEDHSEEKYQENKSEQPSEPIRLDTSESSEIPDDVPVPTFYQELADKHQTRILSASPFVKFAQPYLLQRARELERRVAYLKMLRDQDLSDNATSDEKTKTAKFVLIQPEMVHNVLQGASRKVREIVHAVHDTEYDKALYHYEAQKKQWEAHLSGNKNLFDPYAHQNIVVLFSTVSTVTHVPCSGPDVFAFQFYNEDEDDKKFEADCTLGQYVEDLVFRADKICPAEACGKKMQEHHRHYVHGEGQVTVFVQPHAPKMRGLQDVILMWSACKICGVETTVTPMSPSTWKYSFGKYLELSFWSAKLRARAGSCTHDLHRDHLRYFGYKNFALRIHYDRVDLLEIIVPRMRVTWKVDNDLKFRNNVYTKLEQRITKFMVSVKLRLKSINVDALSPDTADACRQEVEELTKRANDDHQTLIRQLQERYTNSRHWEIIPLNRALRSLLEKVAYWDNAFVDFERNFLPSEKDIRRLATLQLKKIFLDKDVSVTTLATNDYDAIPPPSSATLNEKREKEEKSEKEETKIVEEKQLEEKSGHTISEDEDEEEHPLTRKLSPEKTESVLKSVVEENTGNNADRDKVDVGVAFPEKRSLPLSTEKDIRRTSQDLGHLDLAVTEAVKRATTNGAVDRKEDLTAQRTNSSEVVVPQAKSEQTSISDMDKKDNDFELASAIENHRTPVSPNPAPLHLSIRPPPRNSTLSQSTSPILSRAQSQPSGSLPLRKDLGSHDKQGTMSAIHALNGFGFSSAKKNSEPQHESLRESIAEKIGITSLKSSKFSRSPSMIPRAVNTRKESRVSNLAKHFEQLSREFERERLRERRLQATRNRYSRVYPVAAPKPIVEVYQSVNEAVEELDESEETLERADEGIVETAPTAEGMINTSTTETEGEGYHAEEVPNMAEIIENEAITQQSSHAPSEADGQSEDEAEEEEEIHLPDSPEDLLRLSQEDAEFKDLPKHERSSLMKMLTNFWAERSSSGWSMLEYPTTPSDHIFADCDIVVREDELSSIIAFACDSKEYKDRLENIVNKDIPREILEGFEEVSDLSLKRRLGSLLRSQHSHLKYQFQEGSAKMLCKVFFAEQFDAMRRICGVADRYVESMSRCMKFDSKGGKSKSIFLKTLDDRFVIKSLSPVETQSFLKFAPNYFRIMAETFFHDMPSVIAKMLGFYQIIIRNPATGVEHNWFLIVMENLFYDRAPARIFDLKGSMRNRKINATGEQNEVLLDENMVEFIYESPLFAREHSKRLLRTSVHNDTLFLARQNVMDYSLMIAIDDSPTPSHTHANSQRKELVVGIIDCIRTFTWDKKLESWIKAGSIMNTIMGGGGLGGATSGGKNRPTVTSPKEYKRRFREAMSRYVLEAPDCWHQFRPSSGKTKMIRDDDGDKDEKERERREAREVLT